MDFVRISKGTNNNIDTMLNVANFIASGINDGIRYVREHAWSVVFLLAAWYFLKPKGKLINKSKVYDVL